MSQKMRVSRRWFLKGALAAAAAPYMITSTALGAGAVPAASNRLTTGHIGIGNQGSGLFGSVLGNSSAQILAVCDVRQWVRDKFQKSVEERYSADRAAGTFKGCASYNDFYELAARTDIDAVVIAVPDHWHAIITIEMAKAGKDIYCEKPMALTVRQARAMVNAVRRYGRVYQNGSMQRSMAEFRKGCELVRNGRIGEVKTVNVNVGGPSTDKQFPEQPVPEGMDWNRWLGPAPWAPYNEERCSGNYSGGWRLVRDYSGGMMTDWGAHHFDIAQWGLGMDESGPVEIIPPDGKDVKLLTYKYANGVTMYHGGGGNGVLFTGTKGKIEVNRGTFKSYPDEIGLEPTGPGDIHLYKSTNHMVDWMECIKARRRGTW
jgi:predicted dehydrogenase